MESIETKTSPKEEVVTEAVKAPAWEVKVRVFSDKPQEKALLYCDFVVNLANFKTQGEAVEYVESELSSRIHSIEQFDKDVISLKWHFDGMESEVFYTSLIDLRTRAS